MNERLKELIKERDENLIDKVVYQLELDFAVGLGDSDREWIAEYIKDNPSADILQIIENYVLDFEIQELIYT